MKRVIWLSTLCILSAWHQVQAGIVTSDGREWELRGGSASYANQALLATFDTEWVWATQSDWLDSFQTSMISLDEPDRSSFSGACDISIPYFCSGFFSDDLIGGNTALSLRPLDTGVMGNTAWELGELSFLNQSYRVSYRVSNVPIPAAAWLFATALLNIIALKNSGIRFACLPTIAQDLQQIQRQHLPNLLRGIVR